MHCNAFDWFYFRFIRPHEWTTRNNKKYTMILRVFNLQKLQVGKEQSFKLWCAPDSLHLFRGTSHDDSKGYQTQCGAYSVNFSQHIFDISFKMVWCSRGKRKIMLLEVAPQEEIMVWDLGLVAAKESLPALKWTDHQSDLWAIACLHLCNGEMPHLVETTDHQSNPPMEWKFGMKSTGTV